MGADTTAVVLFEMVKLMLGTNKNAVNLEGNPVACDSEYETIIENDK